MKRILVIVLVALITPIHGLAKDQAGDDTISFKCVNDAAADSKYFPEIQRSARRINQAVCDAILVPVPTRKTVMDGLSRDDFAVFGILVNNEVSAKMGSLGFTHLQKQLDYFTLTLSTGGQYPLAMPVFVLQPSPDAPRNPDQYYYFTGNAGNQGTLTPADETKCKAVEALKAPCSKMFEELKAAIYPYQLNANAITAHDTRVKLTALAADWEAYFDRARAQTFADIAVTTMIEKKHFNKDHLVGPPARQWFVLHPNIVIENAEGAPDGENTKAALSIEWIGVNWWKDSFIGKPFGVSLTSLYSDRPAVKDIGHGITLYFDNKYTIGYARHGHEDGFFVSADLLKLFEDKSEQLERYREKIKDITGIFAQ